ncbi:uncharacterized protein LOC126808473 isoform X2 [Patella vulgata]|nr:uncharacterized protein LOC126808473 isoform X2 [Patella vulgata]
MADKTTRMTGEENDFKDEEEIYQEIESNSSTNIKQKCLSHSNIFYTKSRKYFLVVVVLTFLVGLAYAAVTFPSADVRLNIGIPRNLIRKVRMYSGDPDIKRLNLNKTILSLVSRLQLYDKSECNDDLSLCETYAICDDVDASDSLACRCKRGFYFNSQQCHACTLACPDGHYMTSSCSATSDVVCKECTGCHGSQYEAAVCTTTKDTICVDVSFPVGFLPPNSTSVYDGSNISMSSSSNVFLERLRDMKELETTMYITNNQQSLDFVWKRESGLEIKISVSGVYLVPEYVDLDHEDDTAYFLHFDKNVSEETNKLYQHVVDYYCRHPIPDYYSIHFDTIKNRLTEAEEVVCDSKDKKKRICPDNYEDGETYLYRKINQICNEYEPERRKNLVKLSSLNLNNIICDETNDLLTEVFGQTMPETEKLRFPSVECSQYAAECEKCLNAKSCTNNSYNEDCCSISCYSNSYCLQYYRSTCPPAPVKCAKGNVNQFTLSPVFEKIGERFMCHLKYRKPKYLYNVTYVLQIPGSNYVLPQQNFSFFSDSLESHQTQNQKVDFLNVLHDVRYKLEDEVLVIANHKDYSDQMGEFELHPFKSHDEFNQARGYKVKQDAHYRYSTLVQFYRPFSYSSSTWYRDGCLKNLSKVFPNQTQYKSTSIPVTVKVLNTKKEMQHQMYRSKRSPIVKLSVNKGESILSFFQSTTGKAYINSNSLKASVKWDPIPELWSLHVSGSLDSCPGILNIQIFDKLLVQSLGLFDAFVGCADNFWITFNFTSSRTHLPDVFVVHINDSTTRHHLVLSSVVASKTLSNKISSSMAVSEKIIDQSPPWIPIIVILMLALIALWILFVLYLCLTVRAPLNYERRDNKIEMTILNNEDHEKIQQTDFYPKRRRVSLCVVYIFVVLYILYCIFLSFSVSFGILYAYQKTILPDFSKINDFSDRLQKRVNVTLKELKAMEIKEMGEIQRLFKNRERACKHHLHQSTRNSIHEYSITTQKHLEVIYVQNGSLQYLIEEHFSAEHEKLQKVITDYIKKGNDTLLEDFTHFTSMYKHFLISVVDNKWLEFPREIFIGDLEKMKSAEEMSYSQLKKFVSWLQIDKAEGLVSITDTIYQRLQESAPMPELYQPQLFIETFTTQQVPRLQTNSFKSQNFINQVLDKNNTLTIEELHFDSASNSTKKDILDSSHYDVIMYLFIFLFILMDVLLWCYRISWLCRQLRLSKTGYEVKVPTDESSRKIHILLTGNHPPSTVDIEIENAFKYYKENAAKEVSTEGEFGIAYVQPYPKCKEDILRDIWAYKKSQSYASVTKVNDFCLNECMTIIHWIHRCVISRLTWRSSLTCGAVILLCCLIYAVDNWFNQVNIEVIVGADVVVTELQWQTVMINRHLSERVDQFNNLLHDMKQSVDTDVSHINQLLADTFHKQTRQLLSMLLSVCKSSGIGDCNINTTILLPPPPPITTCNFLPLQQHVIDDVDTAQITALVLEELSPLLRTVRGLAFCILTYLLFVVCFVLLCNAGIRLARYYLLIMGKFPILQIYQISDSLATYADAAADEPPHIYRSASLSCESGVYVGETDESARE